MVERHLREAVDLVDVGVEAVGHWDVNQPVVAAQRNRRLRTLLGERVQARASTAAKDDAKHCLLYARQRLCEVLQTE